MGFLQFLDVTRLQASKRRGYEDTQTADSYVHAHTD